MKYIKKIAVIIFIAGTWPLSSCNDILNTSLRGKSLYYIYVKNITYDGIKVPFTVEELEFDFISEDEVKITPTVVYGQSPSEASNYNKRLTLNYTYKDGNLTIAQVNAPTVKLTESDDFYITSAGETYYKNSILGLSKQEKRDRLSKEMHTDRLDEFLLKENIF